MKKPVKQLLIVCIIFIVAAGIILTTQIYFNGNSIRDFFVNYKTTDTCSLGFTENITQYNITWYFDGCYRYGQFSNGDYYAVGPVNITNITPEFNGTHNGWEINPTNIIQQGFDIRIPDYNESLVPTLPLIVGPNSSIVKSISKLDGVCSYNSNHPCLLQTAAVLTVLDEALENSSNLFRPGYFGNNKKFYFVNEIQTELLPSLEPVASTPTLPWVENRFKRVQLDHKLDWVSRYLHPQDNMPDYGGDIARETGDGALRLMLNDSVSDKLPALINYIQYGIDLHSMLSNGASWPANGGHDLGRKLPLAFAGYLLNDSEIINSVSEAPDNTFHEDGQLILGHGKALWGQTTSEGQWWSEFVYPDSWSKTSTDPYEYIDGGFRPSQTYDSLNLGPWKGTFMAIKLMPRLNEIWNNSQFDEWVDRRVNFGVWTQPDPCAPADGLCIGGTNPGGYCNTAGENGSSYGEQHYCNSYCPGVDAYCNYSLDNYGISFGPNGEGSCITDSDPSDGTGRIPFWHGTNKDVTVYGSTFAFNIWTTYFNFATGTPIASFIAQPQSGYVPIEIEFDASNSLDLDGSIVSYSWNFGDGTIASGEIVNHIYTTIGLFEVSLTITDNSLKSVTTTDTVAVGSPYHIYENFELTNNLSISATPGGLSFDFINGTAYIVGADSQLGYSNRHIQINGIENTTNLIIAKQGREVWNNYNLSLVVGQKYTTGGIVLNYNNFNYYLLNLRAGDFSLEKYLDNSLVESINGSGDSLTMKWEEDVANFSIENTFNGTQVTFVVKKNGLDTRIFVDQDATISNGSIGFFERGYGWGNYFMFDNINVSFYDPDYIPTVENNGGDNSGNAGGGGGGGGGKTSTISNTSTTRSNNSAINSDGINVDNANSNTNQENGENHNLNEQKANTTMNNNLRLILIIVGVAMMIGIIWFGIYKLFLRKKL